MATEDSDEDLVQITRGARDQAVEVLRAFCQVFSYEHLTPGPWSAALREMPLLVGDVKEATGLDPDDNDMEFISQINEAAWRLADELEDPE